jgi:hypothetical protein
MLDTLMRIGAHRIDYFDSSRAKNAQAFAFYIRGNKNAGDVICRDAKSQLYAGLLLIHSKLQMANLAGIYVDVDGIENLKRPAYVQLKQDIRNGLFTRIFILDRSSIMGTALADRDLQELFFQVGGFELLVCRDGECVAIDIFAGA